MSEGRDLAVLSRLTDAAGHDLLDVHTDADHHRSVLTLVGEQAPRAVTALAVDLIDLSDHDGVHPRFGVVDVVPFVPLRGALLADAVRARNDFALWAASTLDVDDTRPFSDWFTCTVRATTRTSGSTPRFTSRGLPPPLPSRRALTLNASSS